MVDFIPEIPHQTFVAAALAALREINGGQDSIAARLMLDWPATRTERATSEGRDIEVAVRPTPTLNAPSAWDAGTVAKILPALSKIPGIDWSLPHAEWSYRQISVWVIALELVRGAKAACEESKAAATAVAGAAKHSPEPATKIARLA